MQDFFPQNKSVFWGLVVLLLALTMIPSLALMETATRYIHFLLEWNPGTIAATRISHIPHRSALPAKASESAIRFVEFKLDEPHAAQVLIAGDFNNWQPEAMARSAEGKGLWGILLPLPPGRYQYSFQVDGVWTPDSSSDEFGQRGELKTSIRQVQ